MQQLELYNAPFGVDRDSFHNKVIKENPYVKIMGRISWSPKDRCYIAVAQVENTVAIVALKEKH